MQHLDAYLEGVSAPEVLAHLQACRTCRVLLAHCRQTVQVYRQQPSPPLPAELHRRLMERVGHTIPPRSPRVHPS